MEEAKGLFGYCRSGPYIIAVAFQRRGDLEVSHTYDCHRRVVEVEEVERESKSGRIQQKESIDKRTKRGGGLIIVNDCCWSGSIVHHITWAVGSYWNLLEMYTSMSLSISTMAIIV